MENKKVIKQMVKNRIKIVIDIAMSILMICLMNINFTGMQLHEILGIVIFIMFMLHKALNFKWIKSIGYNLCNKKVKKRNKILFIFDIALFLLVIGIIITGILISNYVFINVFIGSRGIIKKIHRFLSWWSIVLISIHIGFHLKSVIAYIKSKFNISNANKKSISTIILSLYILFSLFGIISLTKESIYKNFIPDFTTFQYGKERNEELINREYENDNGIKFKNRGMQKNQGKKINNSNNKNEEHFNKVNMFDIISIMIIFVGGTHYIFKVIDNKNK